MDRFEAMTAFVETVDAGGFSAAARELGRSPASITRAVAGLEAQIGATLLRRTTRTVRLTEAGERYLAACRRLLAELAEADAAAAGERAAPRGLLVVTAPATFGKIYLPALVDRFVGRYADVELRLLLVDRVVNLVEEGVDVAIRIAHLPDSSLVAAKVGEVRRVVCASPAYLRRAGTPKEPSDLAGHAAVAHLASGVEDTWSFAGGARRRLRIKIRPRISVTSAEVAIALAVAGRGVTSVLSYQCARELENGTLVRLLGAFELDPLPVHVVHPGPIAASAKVRAFVDDATAYLRAALASKRVSRRDRGARPRPGGPRKPRAG